MQVDVDADAAAVGDAEDDVEMAVDVGVITCWIEPADQVGAGGNRLVKQFGRSGRTDDAALRKGDDLHRHLVAMRIACRQHLLEIAKPEPGVDIDVAAHPGGALRDAEVDHRRRPPRDRLCGGQSLLLELNPLVHAEAGGAGSMWFPRVADETLVEMDMAVDEA